MSNRELHAYHSRMADPSLGEPRQRSKHELDAIGDAAFARACEPPKEKIELDQTCTHCMERGFCLWCGAYERDIEMEKQNQTQKARPSPFTKSVAVREKIKLMVGVAGPSGSGKTWGALQIAYGITGDWSKITLIDTENKSALYYADRKEFGPFEHIPFDPDAIQGGYDPRNYIQAIDFAEADPKTEVIVIDSISHEWEGVGGCLDLVDQIGKGFAGWKTVTPLHAAFIDRMRHGRCHIIATMRTKTDYQVEQINGKATPKKVGLRTNQREGTDYEFGIVFDVDISHHAAASKDRTGLFMGKGPMKLSANTGKQLLEWASSGAESKAESKAVAATPKKYDNNDGAHQEILATKLKSAGVDASLWPEVGAALHGKPWTQASLKEAVDGVTKAFEAFAK